MSILEEMYYGNIIPWEERRITDPEYHKWAKKSAEVESELRKEYPEAETLLNKCANARAEADAILSYQQFAYGFRVGAQLMAEMMKSVDFD